MYSLDINFLKDRNPQLDAGPRSAPMPKGSMTPLIIGVVIGLLLPALVGGMWLFLQNQIAQKEQEKTSLDAELARLEIEEKKIAKIKEDTAKITEETTALASVFNQIKPWSAMLQDIRERIPPGVQISNIQQTQVAAQAQPAAAAAPASKAKGAKAKAAKTEAPSAPSPTMKLDISGTARSFDDVNYFLLTLQRSSFFKGNETQLISAQLVNNPVRVEVPDVVRIQGKTPDKYELPKVVQYKIQTNLSDVPASQLLRELDRKGALGLVTRIRTLQEKGAIQQ